MTVRFTEVHMVSGYGHEHIASLRATGEDGRRYDASRAEWVQFIRDGNYGYVQDAYGNRAYVSVRSNGHTSWIQTVTDGIWSDNLVALPRY